MHFITGGAYNGKRKWVKKYYEPDQCRWLSAYDTALMNPMSTELPAIVILEGVEKWIHAQIDPELSSDTLRKNVIRLMKPWLQWEEADSQRKLVIIGTDISKGIVPIDKRDRLWRDITGWTYQDLVEKAERVDVIWYGIEDTIKNKREL
ncbi:adenosyl cobinamide kinase/adenosyl cobinamide phosphate guanylyltransferase [Virgibacillus natechei]|uniref:Adenosyl cobinamide kinase/adenosyl cobinamide phosphate guanylyltransferase n=1 Tax=Virgibacillus natechei TaxID=1216297 RepID=A0ABS4II18_9BACI|nr:bifunctional adenosylcobinamide kinase/adenosylcobinamide-phosphate guanylyltransferase [Virgibacillus natechei]MBP1969966.1 adenosyl cobinamide kinase/adenosyl cobinamide phosphate guanylyltransferase [Virgibacillus natechei]UZD13374.1 bifunctional adenosylcobinamide kinase/adenosylcobinamide-phosphate guanylyltransferase [Virgibacillus natechei]